MSVQLSSTAAAQVLIVDDEQGARLVMQTVVERCGARAHAAASLREARRLLDEHDFTCALIDKNLGAESGMELLAELRQKRPDVGGILVTGFPNVGSAIEALRLGAIDYVTKPFDVDQLRERVQSVISRQALMSARVEKSSVNADRLATLGTLAASLAHDLRNPLSFVQGNLELANNELVRFQRLGMEAARHNPEPPREVQELVKRMSTLHDYLAEAQEGIDRIRDMINDLSLFVRPREGVVGLIDVEAAITTTLKLARHAIPRHVRVMREEGRPRSAVAESGKLVQILVNLVVNAAQALTARESGGEIRVTVESHGDYTAIAVSDDGPGVPQELRDRIFEPFFTTKPPDVGTGLGLSICRRLVTGFGGRIELDSEPGRGTTFRVLLRSRLEAADPLLATA